MHRSLQSALLPWLTLAATALTGILAYAAQVQAVKAADHQVSVWQSDFNAVAKIANGKCAGAGEP